MQLVLQIIYIKIMIVKYKGKRKRDGLPHLIIRSSIISQL